MKSNQCNTSGDTATADPAQLIASLIPLALSLARKRARSLPACYDEGDLEAASLEGLVKAAQEYDPRSGVPWRAYALFVIRRHLSNAVAAQSVAIYGWSGPHTAIRKDPQTALAGVELLSLSAGLNEPHADPAPGPEEWLLAYDSAERLWRRVASLPGSDAVNIVLGLVEDVPDLEIGERLGLSRTGAWQARQRAITRLRRSYSR